VSAVLPRATACKNKGIKFLTKPLEKKKLHQVTLRKVGSFCVMYIHHIEFLAGWSKKKMAKRKYLRRHRKKGGQIVKKERVHFSTLT